VIGPQDAAPLNVVVCGTRFGQVYLSALARCRQRYRLGGVVARGSARSVALAEEYGVPLYRSVEDLPRDVDAACVAVSGSVGGGPGGRLVQELMERGVRVLQEHPLHPKELADCLRRLGGTGGAVLDDGSLMAALLPVLRSDHRLRDLSAAAGCPAARAGLGAVRGP
jgi:thiazolinyl imide reductase